MTLEYLREYRTYFHISLSYGISESNCYYTIRFVEDRLIKSKCFSLPGHKQLLKSDVEHDYRLFKEPGIKIQEKSKIAVDKGYQGLQKVHVQILNPFLRNFN
jgi:hypothetical protein